MSSDLTNPNDMQIVATTATQKLLFDPYNSGQFYLYTPSTQQLIVQTSKTAKSFYDSAPNQSVGITSWGYTPVEGLKLNNSN